MTRGYGFGYVSDIYIYIYIYASLFLCLSDSILILKIQRKTLKTCTEHNVALDTCART